MKITLQFIFLLISAVLVLGHPFTFRDQPWLGSRSASSAPGAPVPDILWWKCNQDGATTVVADIGPNGTTDCTWPSGVAGLCLQGDGTQEAISGSAVTYGTNIITVALWMWPDNDNVQYLFESGANFLTVADTFAIYKAGANTMKLGSSGTTGTLQFNATRPPTGAWTHILWVVDHSTATGAMKYYSNAVDNTSVLVPAVSTKTGTSAFSAQTFYNMCHIGPTFQFGGKTDDIRIYSGDRSADVNAIFNNPQ